MKLKKLLFVFAGAGFLMVSCEKEVSTSEITEESTEMSSTVPEEVLAKIEALSFNTEGVKVGKSMRPDGTFEKVYFIEEDITMTAEQLKAMSTADIGSKQYRTYNLVSSPRTINVLGYTEESLALSEKQKMALENSVEMYNSLDLGLNFTLTFGEDFEAYDIVVFQVPNGEVGGQAGFPANGDPFQLVQIFSGMEAYSLGVNQHVITHEIGHTLGLRHTDWFSRQSCGRPSFGELANPIGAVHIPGTPRRLDPTSIMLSCFSASEDGEFGEFDIVALEYLY